MFNKSWIMKIESLKSIGLNRIFLAFEEAFKDYEVQITKNQFFTMLQRRGFEPELSFGAFENERLVSFTLNGIGFYNKIKTAYDTGTGTIDKYRGNSLAKRVFEYSMPYLKKNGVENYLLEVLQKNSKAIDIYSDLGFDVSREFNYFVQDIKKIKFSNRLSMINYSNISMNYLVREIGKKFMDFNPSWQNSFESLSRNIDNFKILGALDDSGLIGYCILEPKTGDISQIAISKNHRRRGVGSQLLKEIMKYNQSKSVKVINTPVECEAITKFLESLNIHLSGKQYEMKKEL